MAAADRSAPRALLQRQLINVDLTAHEIAILIGELEARAERSAADADQCAFADFLFRRIVELREALR